MTRLDTRYEGHDDQFALVTGKVVELTDKLMYQQVKLEDESGNVETFQVTPSNMRPLSVGAEATLQHRKWDITWVVVSHA